MLLLKKLVVFVFLIGMLTSCNQPKDDTTTKTKTETETESKATYYDAVNDQISLDTFHSWQNRWMDNFEGYTDSTTLDYFQMPIIDMKSIVGDKADNARMFLGLAVIGANKYAPHLMTMGVTGGVVDSTKIYDYTSACPPMCAD